MVGNGLTVTIVVAVQPVDNEYVINEVPPSTPVTTPEPFIVATPVLLLVHVPPPASLNAVVMPTHTLAVPPIGDGSALTDIVAVATHVVGKV